MERTVALRQRGQVALLRNRLPQPVRARRADRAPAPRHLRTGRQFVLGVGVARSPRWVSVARGIAPQRRVETVKAAAEALG